MTPNKRTLLTIFLTILLVVSSFGTGYLIRDLFDPMAEQGEEFGVYWEMRKIIGRDFLGDMPSTQALAYAAIRGSLGELGDPYTVFIEPVVRDHEREFITGNYVGVGAHLYRSEESGDIILEPTPNNPAEKAGILWGDILTAVDGTIIPPDMDLTEIVEMIKGEKGTAVVLTVIHPDESNPADIEVIRDTILIPSVTWRILEEDEKIGYIQLTRFSGESADEMETAVIELQDAGVEKIIIDLRSNGGGLVDAAVSIADHFIDDGVLLYRQDRSQHERQYNADDKTIAPEIPLAILVDGNTASASEILAGALQDHERAVLIGTGKTFGKGSVQLVYDLSDGSSIHVTAAKWFTPNMNPINKVGLEPDILVEGVEDEGENGRDEVLERAIEYLR